MYRISWICCQLMNSGTKYVFLLFLCHSTQIFLLLLASFVLHGRDGRCAARQSTSSMLRLAQKSCLRHECHHLSTRTNCCTIRSAVRADWSGVVFPTMRVSSMTLASVKAQVAFPPLNPSALLGHSIHMI